MSDNPYQTPAAAIDDPAEAVNTPRIFSFQGRIGRLRYVCYFFVSGIATYFGMGMLVGMLAALLLPWVASNPKEAGEWYLLALYALILVPILVFQIMYTKRRLNDLNLNGWLSLLLYVPLLGALFWLYLVFAPGASGANRYGAPALPNHAGIWLGAVGLPLVGVAMLGVMAAIAIPAYQEYNLRAQAKHAEREFVSLLNALTAAEGDRQKIAQAIAAQRASAQFTHFEVSKTQQVILTYPKKGQLDQVHITLTPEFSEEDKPVRWACVLYGADKIRSPRALHGMRKRCEQLSQL